MSDEPLKGRHVIVPHPSVENKDWQSRKERRAYERAVARLVKAYNRQSVRASLYTQTDNPPLTAAQLAVAWEYLKKKRRQARNNGTR